MASVKLYYEASSNLTATALHDIDTSSTWTAGWTSNEINNSANQYLDYLVSAQFKTATTNMQAGQIRVHVYAKLDDSTWPDIFSTGTEGTEGAATCHDDEQYQNVMRLLWIGITDATAGGGEFHNMPPTSVASVFGGICPAKFAIFVSSNATSAGDVFDTTADLSQVTIKPVYATVT